MSHVIGRLILVSPKALLICFWYIVKMKMKPKEEGETIND